MHDTHEDRHRETYKTKIQPKLNIICKYEENNNFKLNFLKHCQIWLKMYSITNFD